MSKKTIGRTILLTLSLLGLMSLSANAAFGSGKPTSVAAESVFASSNLNYTTVKGSANPNGLATTLTFQYAQIVGGVQEEWHTFKTVEIGSGTSVVSATAKVSGLIAFAHDAYQVIAKNSAGSVTDGAAEVRQVKVAKEVIHPVTYSTSGTWVYTMPGSTQIKCTESGSGKMGTADGAEDYYHASLVGCSVYIGGSKACSHAPLEYTLDNRFKATVSSITTTLCGSEGGEVAILLGNPFEVTVPNYQKYEVQNAMTMVTVNGNTSATSTLSAYLTGVDLNKLWGYEIAEEV